MHVVQSSFIILLVNVCKGQVNEDVNHYMKLITENILKLENYVLPNFYEGFNLTDEHQKPIDFGKFDFIIVGGGTAGSLLSNRLSEVKEWSILLLEGGTGGNEFTDIPGVSSFLVNSPYNWGCNTTPQRSICQDKIKNVCKYPRGKGLGGSTLINDNIFLRGAASDYDKWTELGLEGWSFQDVLPYLKKYENASFENIDVDYHGFNGELVIENFKHVSDVATAYMEILESFGYSMTDINGKNPLGYGIVQQSTYKGRRESGAKVFIDSVVEEQTNLQILTEALVIRIVTDNLRATGVEFIHNETKYHVNAVREVIVSAGVVGSPQLLMLSGIGPSEDLLNLNITPVKDLPVGQFFQDQCVAGIQATTNYFQNTSLEYEISRYLKASGFLTSSARANVYTFHNIKNYPTMELIFLDGFGLQHLNDTFGFTNPLTIALYSVLLYPKSVGRITLASNNPLEFPLINPNSLSETQDLEALVEALDLTLSILSSEPFKKFNVTPLRDTKLCGDYSFGDASYWKCLIQYNGIAAFHGIGSCKMGWNSSESVINERLLVHGMDNIRIIDASVVPSFVTGHLVGTVYMIAEKGADMIKEDNLIIREYLTSNSDYRTISSISFLLSSIVIIYSTVLSYFN
ncbi:glucose dehydrogenase [FAD, quinone]-like [Agrilus planipennis]|uniref:Glucose dehydrogenase [FAD, quinone]-like n=1 Tax=Agrilus planipennis TaxID=224129 RepID=A0A7F5RID8_AGRPL|nr:glucose dehydrogenase [FAD, quinone]-like [Agrilus planipennis]XP_025835768.1 glucose dehydrogenase [FAD, quinone]-like [Agrilus planipennis]XP_025835769.1 glucose dehydrogenase [FAD, quinone]-like [Agrilus planipennis]XP_025835770.1 glucose dehydrogenase [FAD, quinone]-like [Agrilus planipennis]